MTQRNRRRRYVEDGKQRHLLEVRVQNNPENPAEQPAVKRAGRLKCLPAENLSGVCDVITPSAEDQPDLRYHKRNQNAVDTKVPNFIRIESGSPGLAGGPPKPPPQKPHRQNNPTVERF